MALDESSVVLRHEIKIGDIISLKSNHGEFQQIMLYGLWMRRLRGSICGKLDSTYSRKLSSKDLLWLNKILSAFDRLYSMRQPSP